MRRAVAIVFALATFAAAPLAHADAIDGEWCSATGQNLVIDGPRIRLPSGLAINGRYARHAFAYEAPKDGAEAGQIIYMELLDEETMHLRHVKDGTAGAAETWHRCNVTS